MKKIKYNLGFISDTDIRGHVKKTVLKYRFDINLKNFNANLIDPIKLTFDSKVYKKNMKEVLEAEVIRQLDKSNTNHIGFFHQNIFSVIGQPDWEVPQKGFDIINKSEMIFVEIKNKHNTMNSNSSAKTYMKMMDHIMKNPKANCYLVEVIATNTQNKSWTVTVDGVKLSDQRIRRVSIDKFYEIVTGDKLAFSKLCQALPRIIEDVVSQTKLALHSNTVLSELEAIDKNFMKSIFVLAFSKYEGFHGFNTI